MNKNICIIHYNTPILTMHLIKSINKHVKKSEDISIYIFDNSDKSPFTYRQNNIKYIDNTKGQIIDFNEWGKKYPHKTKSFISSKHCYSVQKCMEIIDEPFVLLDSDVLLKQDISGFFNENYGFIGELSGKRILPFICFINTNILKEKNVRYFDDNHTYDLFKNGPKSKREDTGFMLYANKDRLPHKYIICSKFVEHYAGGSYSDEDFKHLHKGQISKENWLRKFKNLWYYEEKLKDDEPVTSVPVDGNKSITEKEAMFKDVFDHIYCLHYLPAKDRLPKIKEELKRVGIDENADYFSWVYDYPSPILDMVYKNPDMKMSAALKNISREYVKHVSLKHYEIIKEAYSLGYKRILIMENDIRFHKDIAYISKMLENVPDTDIVMFDKMTSSMPGDSAKYNSYVKHLPENTLYGNMRETGVFFIFCSCYALNRKAMLRFIQTQENTLLPPDTPLNDNTLTGSFAVVNVAIQEPHLKTRKCESYSKINLSTSLYNTGMATEADGPSKRVIVIPKGDKTLAQSKTERKKIILPEKPERKQQITPPMLNMPVKKKKLIQTSDNKHIHRRRLDIKRTGYNRLYDIT